MTIVESCSFSLGSPSLLRARAAASRFDLHMHETFSIVALIEGSAWLRSKRWSKRAEAGDVFFFNPFEVHAGGSLDQSVRYEVLYPTSRFVADCRPAANVFPLFRTDILQRCASTEAFIDTLSSSMTDSTQVETALGALLRHCSFEAAGLPAGSLVAVRAACELIGERYMHGVDTETLARHVGLHKSHFIRIFRHATGITPQTYLRQLRTAKARDLICEGTELCDAAQTVGFCDQAHMTREFKKVYGVPPGRLSRDLRATRH